MPTIISSNKIIENTFFLSLASFIMQCLYSHTSEIICRHLELFQRTAFICKHFYLFICRQIIIRRSTLNIWKTLCVSEREEQKTEWARQFGSDIKKHKSKWLACWCFPNKYSKKRWKDFFSLLCNLLCYTLPLDSCRSLWSNVIFSMFAKKKDSSKSVM